MSTIQTMQKTVKAHQIFHVIVWWTRLSRCSDRCEQLQRVVPQVHVRSSSLFVPRNSPDHQSHRAITVKKKMWAGGGKS